MSKLSEFRAAERQLADQLAQLDNLKQDAGLKEEIAFNDELKALIKEYGFSAKQVLQIIESQPR